jgi:hypothetical protein
MTTGFKIAIGVVSVAVIATGGYFIFKAVTDGKEKEVRDMEKDTYRNLGLAIEIGRKKHPKLSEWYDSLTISQVSLVEQGWNAMSTLQKEKIIKGIKQNVLPEDIASFFRKKGANV